MPASSARAFWQKANPASMPRTLFIGHTWVLPFILIVVLFCISVELTNTHGVPTEQTRYKLLSDSFLEGRLSLPTTPNRELLSLSNPYEPSQRNGIDYLWDVSFYDSQYFLYFGPTPALVFYLPYKFLSGSYPSEDHVILLASLVTIAMLTLTVFGVARALLGTKAPGPAALWLLYIAFASGLSLQLGGSKWVVAAITGAMFQSLALYALTKALSGLHSSCWATIAGIATIFAVGSRPTHASLLSIAPIALYLGLRNRAGISAARAVSRYLVIALLGCLALGAYNLARFDSPFEFGQTYQLGVSDFTAKPLCSISRLLAHPELGQIQAWYHFLQPPTLVSSFPFLKFAPPSPPTEAVAAGYFLGADAVTGIFAFSPLLPLALLAIPWSWRRATRDARTVWGTSLSIVLINGAFLLTCSFAAARFTFELIGPLLVAGLPALWLFVQRVQSRLIRYGVLSAMWCLLLVGIAIGVSGIFDGHFLKRITPAQIAERASSVSGSLARGVGF